MNHLPGENQDGRPEPADVDPREDFDASISRMAKALRFGEVLAGRCVTTVALDARGRLTRYRPDGTTSPLE
ncbi:hypothetical protein GCM10027300_41800 [Modestobacter lapidis]|nr:hypothetical protein [Modestobacter lapidis]